MRLLLTVCLAALAGVPLSAQTWKVVTDPQTAKLYRVAPPEPGECVDSDRGRERRIQGAGQ